jgi:hypothetical protein
MSTADYQYSIGWKETNSRLPGQDQTVVQNKLTFQMDQSLQTRDNKTVNQIQLTFISMMPEK